MTGRKSVLLVSSSGGVLLELLALAPWWSRHEVVWAAVKAADTETALAQYPVHWVPEVSVGQPLALLPSLLHAIQILRAERPGIVVSAGSGPAIPFFLGAKLAGITTFWLSTHNVLTRPGISARICSRVAARVLLQREEQRAGHPRGLVVGELY
jgi:UDP-N-acetylglucosamine:LPS N-acetylglucosamine transferase